MNNIKKLLCIIVLLPLMVHAQQEAQGIQWASGVSWNQIKQKAKAENKYIFLDCFTTWCGPCKAMDKQVYTNDTVASFFNKKFIPVKVQMDKTAKDNEEIKKWYADVEDINKKYHIEAYPSFVFLSPQGGIVNQGVGYKNVKELITMAQTSLDPKMVYNNPYAEYERLANAYRNGERNYDVYPYMIMMAAKSRNDKFSDTLLKELTDYVSTLKPNERYTKDRVQMWAGFTFTTTSKVFQFFYKDGKAIDKVMDRKGYASDFVDKCIMADVVQPFLEQQAKGSKVAMKGGYLTDVSGKHLLKTDSAEADWKKLDNVLNEKFGREYAERNVLSGKIEWYKRHWNYVTLAKHSLLKAKKYPPTDLSDWRQAYSINEMAWNIFMNVTDKKMIDEAILWMEKLIQKKANRPEFLDTYANLLFKAGRTKEAISWEEKAAAITDSPFANPKGFQKIAEQMKKGEPTNGAVWGYN